MIKQFRRAIFAAAITAIVAVPGTVAAQSDFDFVISGGIAVPLSDMADAWDVGPNFTFIGDYWFKDRLAFRVEVGADLLSGDDIPGKSGGVPDMEIYRFGAGLAYSLTDRASSKLSVLINGGGGLSLFNTDPLGSSSSTEDLTEVYFHINGGAEVGYKVSDRVTLGIQGQFVVAFTDEDDIAFLNAALPGSGPEDFDTALTLPITAVIRIHF